MKKLIATTSLALALTATIADASGRHHDQPSTYNSTSMAQGQHQGQNQGQSQTSRNTNQNNVSNKNTNANANANNASNGAVTNTNVSNYEASAFAPAIGSSGECAFVLSGGVVGAAAGVSFPTGKCTTERRVMILQGLAGNAAALQYLANQDRDIMRALNQQGMTTRSER